MTVTQPSLYLAPLHNTPDPIRRVLIANRGEIALRVARTCALLGIESVAVYVEEDARSPHVAAATTAVALGPVVPADPTKTPPPYLDADLLIRKAIENDCDAIHPGYGYLSENPDFADAVCRAPFPPSADGAGPSKTLRFIGPSSASMREMGDKAASKSLLRARLGAEAPLVPGYDGADQDVQTLVREAKTAGFPILLKASAGGGGKGMRVVRDEQSLASEIERAKSEAQRSFGNSRLLIERYIEGGKHIEVQIFGDSHGTVFAFGERECSVQRRHQKIIEETPSPALTPTLRAKMCASAVQIGKLLAYEGAATVEYIFDTKTGDFFFLEVNTRLQVEHPVTEMTRGLDLVSLQLYVASGGKLSDLAEVVNSEAKGHSIECRLCAEEPSADFAPRTGLVRAWHVPLAGREGVRYDSGVESGSSVTIHFDPMLAKIIVHASDRKAAIARMLRVLEASICLGVGTNISFMAACLEHPSFKDGSYTTALIPSNIDALLARPAVIAQRALLGAPSTSGAAIPIHAIAPAWAFFYRLRRLFSPLRAGLRPGWRLHGQDHAQVQAESYEVTLPDAGGRFDVMLEYVPGGGDTFELRMWSNTADKTEETVLATQLERAKQKKGSKAKATPTLTQERAAAVARYYASRPTRAGVEGRESSSKWAFGVQPDVVFRTNVSVVDAELSVHASAGHNQRWAHGTLRLEVAGRTTTHVLASDETFDAPDSGAQTAWSWVTALAGPVKVVRRSMLVYAGRLDSATAGAVADESTYTTPMPCRILQLLARDGDKVKQGDGILIMESMKTEVKLLARTAGKLSLQVKEGDTVGEGRTLCVVEPDTE